MNPVFLRLTIRRSLPYGLRNPTKFPVRKWEDPNKPKPFEWHLPAERSYTGYRAGIRVDSPRSYHQPRVSDTIYNHVSDFENHEYQFWRLTGANCAQCRACGEYTYAGAKARKAHQKLNGCARKLVHYAKTIRDARRCVVCAKVSMNFACWGFNFCGTECVKIWRSTYAFSPEIQNFLKALKV